MSKWESGTGKADLLRLQQIAQELVAAHDMDEDKRRLTYGEGDLLVQLTTRAREITERYIADHGPDHAFVPAEGKAGRDGGCARCMAHQDEHAS